MRTTLAIHMSGVASCGLAGHTQRMGEPAFDFSKLSVPERIQLVEDLWDSVAAESPALPLSEDEIAELKRRLDELDRNPEVGILWEQVKADIERRFKRP
jgi:putative addiction module component (TIGR02574 family)